jgi:putative flippase GtrA
MSRVRQLVRYGAVSLVATTCSLTTLGVLAGTRTLPAAWANVVATAIGTVPSFELNRRWVWAKKGKRSTSREVVPFVALSFAGLALSTLAVHFTAAWADRAALTTVMRTLFIEGANVGAFGSLWILQFVMLDRLLFRAVTRHEPPCRPLHPAGLARDLVSGSVSGRL